MTTNPHPSTSSPEIVARYLSFFRAHGHQEIPGSSLVLPEGTTSFVIAGMQPLLPYLRGAASPPDTRLTDIQRCLRTVDIALVGTNARKLSFFHMLGNWSIGDYGRDVAITLALTLVRDVFQLDPDVLWVTTFAGDSTLGLPPDEEAPAIWQRLGIAPSHIVPLGLEDNFWSTGGPGPCGPCTEIFADRGAAYGCGQATCQPGCACDRFLEFWNLVFIQYERQPDERFSALPLRSVDTGMGLERVAALLQGVPSVYGTDLLAPAITMLAELAPPGSAGGGVGETRMRRRIVDHVRAACFLGLAGVTPDHAGRGSVLKRLIRRAATQGQLLTGHTGLLGKLVAPLTALHVPLLSAEEQARVPAVTAMLSAEEARFSRTLAVGLREIERLHPNGDGLISGDAIFRLQAERGFPVELAGEVLSERGMAVDWPGYERALEEHRAISRVSAERHFRPA